MSSTDQKPTVAEVARSSSSAAEPDAKSSGSKAQPYVAETTTPAIRTRPASIVVRNASSSLSTQASAERFARAVRLKREARERRERGSPEPRYTSTNPILDSTSSKASSTAPSLVDSQARSRGTTEEFPDQAFVLETHPISSSSNASGTRSKSSKKSSRFAEGTNAARAHSNRTHSSSIPRAPPTLAKRSAARVPLSSSSGSSKRQSLGTHSPTTQRVNLTAGEIVIECEIRSLLMPVIRKLTSNVPLTPDSNLEVRQMAQDILGFARAKKACRAGIGRCCFYVGYTLYNTRERTQMQVAMLWFERARDASINGYPEGDWARLFINRWQSLNLSPTHAARSGSSDSGSWIADRVADMWNYLANGASPRVEQRDMGYHIHGQSPPHQYARSASSRASESPQSLNWDHHGLVWSRNHPFGKGDIMPGKPMELVQSPKQMSEHEEYDEDDDEQDYPNNILGGLVDASALNPKSPRPMPNIQEHDDDEQQGLPHNIHGGHVDTANLTKAQQLARAAPPGPQRQRAIYIQRNPRNPQEPDLIIFDKKVVPPAWRGPQQVKDSHRQHDDPFVEEGSSVQDTRPPDRSAFTLLRPAAEPPIEETPVWRHQGRVFASGTRSSVDTRYTSSRQAPGTRTSSVRSGAHLPSPYNPRWARSASVVATSPNSDGADETTEPETPRRRRMNSLSIIATGFNTIGALSHRRQSNVLGKAEEGDSPFQPNAREAGLYQRKPSDATEDV